MVTTEIWQYRVADEYGHYPAGWILGEPKWKRGTSEQMDLFGLEVSLWEISVDLEELDDAH